MLTFNTFLKEKKIEIPKSNKPITGVFNNPNMEVLGTGIQSTVYSMKSQPSSVLKVVNVVGDNDPSIQFLRLCSNHQDNPYFPIVRGFKLYDRAELSAEDVIFLQQNLEYKQYKGKQILLISMEKLNSIKDFEPERVLKMLQVLGLVPTDIEFEDYYDPIKTMWNRFKDSNYRQLMMTNTPDPKLKNALRLLEPLFKKFKPDVHGNNIMMRYNGSKIHLVFTDPIWTMK